MSSVQERLQLKRVPLDKWSVREQLCLATAVECSGDQNWMSVSRSLKMLATSGAPAQSANRPSDWFSQKFCAAQYGKLLENVETPKRKKRTDKAGTSADAAATSTLGSVVETPGESILRKLTHERMSELNRLMLEEQREHDRLREEIALVQATTDEAELRRIWQQIEAEQRHQERETAQQAHWLKEREARKLEQERAWRPAAAVVAQQQYAHKVTALAGATTSTTAAAAATAPLPVPVSVSANPIPVTPRAPAPVPDSIVVIEDMDIDEDCTPKSDTSPLLTSLLKSPSATAPTSAATSMAATQPSTAVVSTAISRVAPTITNLLTGGHKPLHVSIAPSGGGSSAPPTPTSVSTAGIEAMLSQSLTGPPPAIAGHSGGSGSGGGRGSVSTPPVQSPSQAAPTLSMLLENKSKEQAKLAQLKGTGATAQPLQSPVGQSQQSHKSSARLLPSLIIAPSSTPPIPSPPSKLVLRPEHQAAIVQPIEVTTTAPQSTPPKPSPAAAISEVMNDADVQMLMDEFNGLIPDNIDELLTDNNLDADQLLDEADDSILDGVDLLMAGEAEVTVPAATLPPVVIIESTAKRDASPIAVPLLATVDAADDADDVHMAAELGDANEPIIDVAAATAAANAGGTELMTTAELVEQLTSSEPTSALAAGFPLNVPPLSATRTTPVASPTEGRAADSGASGNADRVDDDDDDDDVVLIEAAMKADGLEEMPATLEPETEVAIATAEPVSLSDILDTEENSQDGMSETTITTANPPTKSPVTKDDDQSNSSNDAPLSELLKDKNRLKDTKSPAAIVADVPPAPATVEAEAGAAAADQLNDDDDAIDDSPKGSERTDVFESDSNDDKCLEIIKREIHELTGLKENESSENSNESGLLSLLQKVKPLETSTLESLESDADTVKLEVDVKTEKLTDDDAIEEVKATAADEDDAAETIEDIINEIEKTEVKITGKTSPQIAPSSKVETMSDTDDEVLAAAAAEAVAVDTGTEASTDAGNDADADDEDAADIEEVKEALPEPTSPLPLPFCTAADTPIQIDDTEDEDQPPVERPTRFGGRPSSSRTPATSSGSQAASTRSRDTTRRRRDATSQDPATPQPPSDTDSTASHLSQTAGRQTRRRLRERDGDRDRSESPFVADGIRTPGDTDSEARSSRSKRRFSSTLIDSMPNSPASLSGTVDMFTNSADSRDYRAWKKSIHLVLNRLAQHRHSGPFRRPIADESAAADYRSVVLRPMDLQTLRRNVDAGLVRTTADVQRDVMLMCSNAIWYGAATLSPAERRTRVRLARDMETDALHCIVTIMEATWRPQEKPAEKRMEKPSGLVSQAVSSGSSSGGLATPASAASKIMRGRKSHRLPPSS